MGGCFGFKIKRKTMFIIMLLIILLISVTGWYFYSAYHPIINIFVSDSTVGEKLKVEAPHIAYADNVVPMASSIELKIDELIMQHEFMCKTIRDTYSKCDIKIKVIEKDDKTILRYFGSGILLNGDNKDFNEQIIVDYILEANIKYQ